MMETSDMKGTFPAFRSEVFVLMDVGPMCEDLHGWQVSRDQAITQLDPATGTPTGETYAFDKVFVRQSKKMVYNMSIRNLIIDFCTKKQSAAVIVYGSSHTGMGKYLKDTQKQDGLFQSAIAEILNCLQGTSDNAFHLLRMSYVDVYCEKVEDLLVTDVFSDTNAQQPGLQLAKDNNGYVVWLDAKEPIISSQSKMEKIYAIGHNEHVMRGHKTKGRREAVHSIVRLILECLPENLKHKTYDSGSSTKSYLDFVCVAGSKLMPTFTGLVDELIRGPPRTRSLYALHQFVCNPNRNKNKLYGSCQSTLTQLLHEALVGRVKSVFFCVCDPCDHQQTHATLRFGRAASYLFQSPCVSFCPSSKLHSTICKILKCLDKVQPFYSEVLRKKFDHKRTVVPSIQLAFEKVYYILEEMKTQRQMILPQNKDISPEKDCWELYHKKPKRRGRPTKAEQAEKLSKAERIKTTHFRGVWHPDYPRETRRNYDCDEGVYKINKIRDQIFGRKKCKSNDIPSHRLSFGTKKRHFTISPYDDFVGLSNFLVWTFYTSVKKRVCDGNIITSYFNNAYEMKDYKPKKVWFPLNKIKLCGLASPSDSIEYHRFLLLIYSHILRDKSDTSNLTGKQENKMPHFIALKEIFKDLYMTPYRRPPHLWKILASMIEGKIYLCNEQAPSVEEASKLSTEMAFIAFLQGQVPPGKEGCEYDVEAVNIFGDNWQVFKGKVDGIALFYIFKVYLFDELAKTFQWFFSKQETSHPHIKIPDDVFKKFIESNQRNVMYKTHLHKAPVDTNIWREYQWNEFLGWWADYQLDKIPNILAGELEGDTVTALRLYSAAHLPELAKVWCRKKAWDSSVCEKYLASLLHFMNKCFLEKPVDTLNFELKQNGDVLCFRKKVFINKTKIKMTPRGLADGVKFFAQKKYKKSKKRDPLVPRVIPHIQTIEGLSVKTVLRGLKYCFFIPPPSYLHPNSDEYSPTRYTLPHIDRVIKTKRKRCPLQKRVISHVGPVKREQTVRENNGQETGNKKRKVRNEMEKQDGEERQEKRRDPRKSVIAQEMSPMSLWTKNAERERNEAYAFYKKLKRDMTFRSKRTLQKKQSADAVHGKSLKDILCKRSEAKLEEANAGIKYTNLWGKNQENEGMTHRWREAKQGKVRIDDTDINLRAMGMLKKKLCGWTVHAQSLQDLDMNEDSSPNEGGKASLIAENVLESSPDTQKQHINEDIDETDFKVYFDELSKVEDNTLKLTERPPNHGKYNKYDNQKIRVKQQLSESEEEEFLPELSSSDE